jgi:hypothetical protein
VGTSGYIQCEVDEFSMAEVPAFRALSYTWLEDTDQLGPLIDQLFWSPVRSLLARLSAILTAWLPGPIDRLYSRGRRVWQKLGRLLNPVDDNLRQSDGSLLQLIVCNGEWKPVTPGLHKGLREISRAQAGYWWIDQLCIDQEPEQTLERNHQVARMDTIFGAAETVYVWLGAAARMEAGLPETFRALAEEADEDDDLSDMTYPIRLFRSVSAEKLFAFVIFITQGWFARVWTVQEFALAKEVIFLHGSSHVTLDEVSRARPFMRRMGKVLSLMMVANSYSLDMYFDFLVVREKAKEGTPWTVEQWLQTCRGRKASRTADYVFAGLSLLKQHSVAVVPDISSLPKTLSFSEDTPLGADYAKPAQTVWTQFTVALLTSNLGINALSLVGAKQDEFNSSFRAVEKKRVREQVGALPSWVVPLHQPLLPTPLYHYPASPYAKKASCQSLTTQYSGEPPQLVGRALLPTIKHMDTVRIVGNPLFTWLFNNTFGERIGSEYNLPFDSSDMFTAFLSVGPVYQHTGELSLTAIRRTLTLDLYPTPEDGDAALEADRDFEKAIRQYFMAQRQMSFVTLNRVGKNVISAGPTALAHLDMLEKAIQNMVTFPHAYKERGPEYMDGFLDGQSPLPDRIIKRPFIETFDSLCRGRRFFVTEKGYIGLGPSTTQPGDYVTLLEGAWAPYILRPKVLSGPEVGRAFALPDDSEGSKLDTKTLARVQADLGLIADSGSEPLACFTLVGEAYVHGIMDKLDNSAAVECQEECIPWRRVCLV